MIMQTVRAPVSHPIDIDDLRPTQMTVGYREIETHAARLKKLAKEKLVRKHVIPVVKGPKDRLYVIDHHHLCRALLLAGSDQRVRGSRDEFAETGEGRVLDFYG